MIQQTSIDAYEKLKESKVLGKLQLEVAEILIKSGPLTQGEVVIRSSRRNRGSSITPRFAELEDAGVIEHCGSRECTVTKNDCLVWKYTGRIPESKKSKKHLRVLFMVEADGKILPNPALNFWDAKKAASSYTSSKVIRFIEARKQTQQQERQPK